MELKWLWQNSDKEMKFFSRMCLLETRRAWLIMCMCSRAHAQKAISNDSWTQSTTKKTYISASVLGALTDPHFARFYPCSDASCCIFLLHTHSEKTESICFCWQETDRPPGSRNNLPCLYKCGCLYYISKCKREEIKKALTINQYNWLIISFVQLLLSSYPIIYHLSL